MNETYFSEHGIHVIFLGPKKAKWKSPQILQSNFFSLDPINILISFLPAGWLAHIHTQVSKPAAAALNCYLLTLKKLHLNLKVP